MGNGTQNDDLNKKVDNEATNEEHQMLTPIMEESFVQNDLRENVAEKNISNIKRKSINWFRMLISSCALITILLLILILVQITKNNNYAMGIEHKNWEYKVLNVQTDEINSRDKDGAFKANTVTPSNVELNKLGKDGWEVVTSYLEVETSFPNFGNQEYVTGIQPNVRPQRVVIILKRQISSVR